VAGSTQTQWGREYTLLWSRAARKGKGKVKLKGGERTEQGKELKKGKMEVDRMGGRERNGKKERAERNPREMGRTWPPKTNFCT